MKTVVIWSSPNKDGLTAAAKDCFVKGLKNRGMEVEEIHLNALSVEHCRACGNGWGLCAKEGRCVIADDFAAVYEKLVKADGIAPADASADEIARFLEAQVSAGISKRSQARVISSIKALYRFLDAEGVLAAGNPCDRLSAPKINAYLPTVLSVAEVVAILDAVDLSQPEGHRNRCILEVLYSCGLRVSELVNLRISDLFPDEQFVRVSGKGSKQRLVPIGEPAVRAIRFYREIRDAGPVQKAAEDILFLNRRGGKLTREMIFRIVKEATAEAGIRKNVSPHTFS